MARQGLKVHQTRTPRKMAKTPLPKGKTLTEIHQGAKTKT